MAELFLELAAPGGIARHEHQAATVLTRLGQVNARFLGGIRQKSMRHLHQHSSAIAGIHFAPTGAAMIEIAQYLDRLLHDAVRPAALDIRYKPETTGVVLESRVVKPLLRRGLESCLLIGHDFPLKIHGLTVEGNPGPNPNLHMPCALAGASHPCVPQPID